MSSFDIASSSKAISFLVIGVLFLTNSVQAFARRGTERTPEVVVVHPDELPAAARVPAQAMYLHAVGFSRYLYLEQESGKRLAVFDVSRPAHIKTVAEMRLEAPRFEFLAAVNSRFALIRFAGSQTSLRVGVLDLKNPQKQGNRMNII